MEIPYTLTARPDTVLYNGKLGIWLFLASEVMLFGAIFTSYLFVRLGADAHEKIGGEERPEEHDLGGEEEPDAEFAVIEAGIGTR